MIDNSLFRRRLLLYNSNKNCISIKYGNVGFPGTVRILGENFDISKVKSVTINNKEIEIAKTYTYEDIPDYQLYTIQFDNLTDLSHMIEDCVYDGDSKNGIISVLNVSNLNTKDVVSAEAMLKNAYIGKLVGFERFNTENIVNMSKMFSDIHFLNYGSSLNLNYWNTSKVETFESMFSSETMGANGFKNIKCSSWDTSKSTNMFKMFHQQIHLTELDLSNWDTSKVTNMSSMFEHCLSLQSLKMLGPTNPQADVTDMFKDVTTYGTFYYNPNYDYSHIIAQLPTTWTAVPIEQ
jgi:surface protein